MPRPIINTRRGKRSFVRSLAASIVRSVCAAVPQMPAEWDGHELRELLAELFERERIDSMRYPRRHHNTARAKAYRNARWLIGRI